jgi:hypothetical protein
MRLCRTARQCPRTAVEGLRKNVRRARILGLRHIKLQPHVGRVRVKSFSKSDLGWADSGTKVSSSTRTGFEQGSVGPHVGAASLGPPQPRGSTVRY